MELGRRNAARLANLEKANAAKRSKAHLRHKIRQGEVDPVKLIAGEVDEFEALVQRWRIEMLVRLVRGIGTVTATEIYVAGQFSPTQRLSSLSPQRRKELARLCEQGRRLSGHGG